MAGSPGPQAAMDKEFVITELLDENRLLEQQLSDKQRANDQVQEQMFAVMDKSNQKDKMLLDCLQALLGYCTMLEKNVVQPAVHRLRDCLQSHYWQVLGARDDLVSHMSGVSAPTQSKLVRLFGQFHNPAAGEEASRELRRQVWDRAERDGFQDPADAYTVVARLVEEQDQLAMILKFCTQQLQETLQLQRDHQNAIRQGTAATPDASGANGRSVQHLQRQMEVLQQQNDSLKQEVKRLEVISHEAARTGQDVQDFARQRQIRNEEEVHMLAAELQQLKAQNQTLQADFHLVLQEKNILTQQGESLEATVKQERSILNQKIESQLNALTQLQHQVDHMTQRAETAERELANVQRERQAQVQQQNALETAHSAAQRKLESAEVRALQLEQERAIVRQKFETVERALTQGAAEKASLREEVDELRQRLMSSGGGDPAAAAVDHAARLKLQQEREESARLRLEIERLHRDRGPPGAPEEMQVLQRENASLRDAQLRLEAGAAAARKNEDELQARVRQLQDVAQKLKAELEHVVQRSSPSRNLSGASAAPLPTGAPTDGMQGRITSFEMCINQLNSELGNVEGRINSLDQSANQTSRDLAVKLERERQQFEQERSECDHIVQRMADELELLIRENQQLKQQQQVPAASPMGWPPDGLQGPPLHPPPGAAPSPSPPHARMPLPPSILPASGYGALQP